MAKTHVFRNDLNKEYPVVEKGEGVYLYDKEGKRYLDGAGGMVVVGIGHGVKEIAQAMEKQAEEVAFTSRLRFSSAPAEELAEKLCGATRGEFEKVYYATSGSEATEISVKLARKYHIDNGEPSRFKVISRWGSYHGATTGALSWSGHVQRRRDYIPYLHDSTHIAPAYCYRCWFGQEPKSCNLECAEALEHEILYQGPENISAFIAEPIVGSTLAVVAPRENYFQKIREICDRYGVLLILDEVMTGFGRTGRFFAYEHFNMIPDIIAIGKGLTSGYFPMAGVMTTLKVWETIAQKSGSFVSGHTYSATPLGCAVGNKTFDYLIEHNLIERSAKMGKILLNALETLKQHPTVGDVRGKGLMVGIEFVKDKETKETIDKKIAFSSQISKEATKRGLLVSAGVGCADGQNGDSIHLGPPFIITEEQINDLVNILDNAIFEVESKLNSK